MKKLRTLRSLEDWVRPSEERVSEHGGRKFTQNNTFSGVRKFDREFDSKRTDKHKRLYLLEAHNSIFGSYPEEGTNLEVVRARIITRLQFEGHRLNCTIPSKAFLQNYNTLMQFSADPFDACTGDVRWNGKMLSLLERNVSMSATKQVRKIAKASAKASSPKVKKIKAGKKGTGNGAKRKPKIYDTYSMCQVIRFLCGKHCTTEQIEHVLKAVKIQVDPGVHQTVIIQSGHVRRGKLAPDKLEKQYADKILKLVPPKQASVKKIKAG